jgi:UDP-N-acetylmuramoylalanine--D-glutamate ligase
LRGQHNAVNALMALALAWASGRVPDVQALLPGLRTYIPEPHRLQLCGHWRGVEAFDDSKGTNVGATVAALKGLGAERLPGRLVLILGGDGKGQRFDDLVAPISQYARAVALIGRDAPILEALLQGAPEIQETGLPVRTHTSMEDAVAWGFAQAHHGDALLLSPACASWDMFKDYSHRGQVFAAAVASWCREHPA